MLLHGWGSSLDAFSAVRNLLDKKYKVVSLDFPGFGQSDMPPEPWDVERYAAFTLEFFRLSRHKGSDSRGSFLRGRVIMKLCGTGRVNPEKIIFLDAAGVKPKKSFKSKCRSAAFKTVKKVLSAPL